MNELKDTLPKVGEEISPSSPIRTTKVFAFGSAPGTLDIIEANNIAKINEDVYIYVGPSGTFTTIADALEFLTRYTVLYKKEGIKVTILLQDAFVMTEQIIVKNLDLSWITLEKQYDSIVQVDLDTLTTSVTTYGIGTKYPLFYCENGKQVKLNARFLATSGDDRVSKVGYILTKNSFGCISPGNTMSGFSNDSNVIVENSSLECPEAVFSSATTGIRSINCSRINARAATITGNDFGAVAVGGVIDITGADVSSNNILDGRVDEGGQIIAPEMASASWSQTPLQVTESGIIFAPQQS